MMAAGVPFKSSYRGSHVVLWEETESTEQLEAAAGRYAQWLNDEVLLGRRWTC